MTDRLIRITTTLAVLTVAGVAAIISYQHAYELVSSHGESGVTARLLPFTVDGLIWAASMVVLDASRRNRPVPRLAAWSLGAGIVATVTAPGQRGLLRRHVRDQARTGAGSGVTANTAISADHGRDGPSLARRGSQPTRNSS